MKNNFEYYVPRGWTTMNLVHFLWNLMYEIKWGYITVYQGEWIYKFALKNCVIHHISTVSTLKHTELGKHLNAV